MLSISSGVYLACAATSGLCLIFLARGYCRTGLRFLFWAALCFLGLAANNVLLVMNAVIYPGLDLRPLRDVATLFGLGAMLFGFLWDTEMWS